MFGFLNVYKPQGKTSHDVVAILRRITGVKQIGHTGTLDPFAEGVLPVCIGKATRLIEYLNDEKAYIGTVKLGQSTTTYDIEGDVVKYSDKDVTIEEIEAALQNFRGEIEQTPPIYSAIKVKGKKLYEYARKGEAIEVAPRKVKIEKLDIVNYRPASKELELYISCSKGTYIRSIANDLGEALSVYGHLIKLIRVQAGDFILENSIKLEKINNADDVTKHIENPLEYLKYPKYELDENEKIKISHGMNIEIPFDGRVILTFGNKIAAVGDVTDRLFKCNKVFL